MHTKNYPFGWGVIIIMWYATLWTIQYQTNEVLPYLCMYLTDPILPQGLYIPGRTFQACSESKQMPVKWRLFHSFSWWHIPFTVHILGKLLLRFNRNMLFHDLNSLLMAHVVCVIREKILLHHLLQPFKYLKIAIISSSPSSTSHVLLSRLDISSSLNLSLYGLHSTSCMSKLLPSHPLQILFIILKNVGPKLVKSLQPMSRQCRKEKYYCLLCHT